MSMQATKKTILDSREGAENPRFYEISRFFVGLVLPLVAKLRIEGMENIPAKGPVVLAMNHIAWIDIPLASIRVRRITHYMAKIEIFNTPIIGQLVRWWGAFSVRRGEGDREAIRTADRVLQEGKLLVIFPEGHRSGGHLIEGKSGTALIALRAHVPVIPVAISGTERVFKGLHYGPFAPRVTITFGKPFQISPETGRYSRDDVVNGSHEIMVQIAKLLPPAYRGIYAEDAARLESSPAAPQIAPKEQTPAS